MSQHNTCTQTEVWYPISFFEGYSVEIQNFWIFLQIFSDIVKDQYLVL